MKTKVAFICDACGVEEELDPYFRNQLFPFGWTHVQEYEDSGNTVLPSFHLKSKLYCEGCGLGFNPVSSDVAEHIKNVKKQNNNLSLVVVMLFVALVIVTLTIYSGTK